MKKVVDLKLWILLLAMIFFMVDSLVAQTIDTTKSVQSGQPKIQWQNPISPKTIIKSEEESFKAIVKSLSGLNSVKLFLDGSYLGEPEMKPSSNVPGNFYVEKKIRFKPGEHNIYIEASNSTGTVNSEYRYILYQPKISILDSIVQASSGKPVIQWNSPLWRETSLKSPEVSIKALVRSPSGINSILLYVNGMKYGEPVMKPVADYPGSFLIEKTIKFDPGEYNLHIEAANNNGTVKSESRSLIYQIVQEAVDSNKASVSGLPIISWTNPSSQITNLRSSNVNIKATVKSASGLNSVVIFLNGILYGEPEMKPSPNVPGNFYVTKTIKVNPGENNIYIVATNNLGESLSEKRFFTSSYVAPATQATQEQAVSRTDVIPTFSEPPPVNPVASKAQEKQTEPLKTEPLPKTVPQSPVITWVSPSGPKTTMDSFNATVKANIRADAGLNSVLLYLNGISKGETEIKSSPDGSGSFLVEKNIDFGPGENNIYLVATTSDGVTAKSEIRYFANPSAILPEISWSTPSNPNSVVGAESFIISAGIKSPTDLKSVKLYVNADVQSEDNIFNAAGAEGNYNWENSVLLRKGENSIYIVAMNAAGSTRSEKRVIKFEENLTEKRLALVFGNSRYIDKPPLKNPVNDANLMAATLEELGFVVIKRLDAKRDDMMGAIREFNEKLPDYSVALFYYAGHGNQVDGKNYIIPTDAVLEKPGDCKFEAIGVDFIVEEFERYPDNTNIVILDACRDNPFATWSRGETAGFKPISFSSGTIIVFATSEGATAADGRGDNGLFTEVLVKQMLIPQSIFSVVMKTRVEVRRVSNNQQTPMEWNKLNGDFYFRK